MESPLRVQQQPQQTAPHHHKQYYVASSRPAAPVQSPPREQHYQHFAARSIPAADSPPREYYDQQFAASSRPGREQPPHREQQQQFVPPPKPAAAASRTEFRCCPSTGRQWQVQVPVSPQVLTVPAMPKSHLEWRVHSYLCIIFMLILCSEYNGDANREFPCLIQ